MDAGAGSIDQLQSTDDGPRQSSVAAVAGGSGTDDGRKVVETISRSSSGPMPSRTFPPKSTPPAISVAHGPSGIDSLDETEADESKAPGRQWETLAEYLASSSRDRAGAHDSPHDSDSESEEAPWSLGGGHGRSAKVLAELKWGGSGQRVHSTPSVGTDDDAPKAALPRVTPSQSASRQVGCRALGPAMDDTATPLIHHDGPVAVAKEKPPSARPSSPARTKPEPPHSGRKHGRDDPSDRPGCGKKVKSEQPRHAVVKSEKIVKAEKKKSVVKKKKKKDGDKVEEEADEITYRPYRPSKLRYGMAHPDPVVENATLAAVDPPDITYNLALPADIISEGKLSDIQVRIFRLFLWKRACGRLSPFSLHI